MEYKLCTSDELTHWGVPGMKWGVRRYQRKDGSLTPAGERHLKRERAKLKKEEQVLKNRKSTQAKFDRLEAKRKSLEEKKKELDGDDDKKKPKKGTTEDAKQTKKTVKDMSDDDLVKAINRGRLEEAYRQLYPEPPVKPSLMKRMVDDVVAPAAINSGKQFLQSALTKAGENLLKGKVDPNSMEALTAIRDKLKVQTEIAEYKMGGKFNWDNMLKKQQFETQADDRKSRMKGYKDAPDEAASKKADDEAARKAAANEAARKANETKSREYYNSTYSKQTGEKTTVSQATVNDVRRLLGSGKTTTALATTNNISDGRREISGLLEGPVAARQPNEIGYVDNSGRFHPY